MNQILETAKPLFLMFISNQDLTDDERHTLQQIRENFSEYISDTLLSDNEDPIYYIYIKYCQELIAGIEDSKTAEETYDFINELYENCTDKEFAASFEAFADEALGLFNSHHIDEFYDTLVESYEEERFQVIEKYRMSLAKLYMEDPGDIDVTAQSNILHIMVAKWSFQKTLNAYLADHIAIIIAINQSFAALMKYPHLSDKVIRELHDVWHEWFIPEYVTGFFVPLLDFKYKIDNKKKIREFLELTLNHNPESDNETNSELEQDEDRPINFINLMQDLLLGYVDTCIPPSRNDIQNTYTKVNECKREKNSPSISINFGKHDPSELSITIIIELLKVTNDSNSYELLLLKLKTIFFDFAPLGRKEWLISCHRVFSDLAMNHVSDTNKSIRGIYIQMIQFLEHCYYNNTNGRSIPIPPANQSSSNTEKLDSADARTQTRARPSIKLV